MSINAKLMSRSIRATGIKNRPMKWNKKLKWNPRQSSRPPIRFLWEFEVECWRIKRRNVFYFWKPQGKSDYVVLYLHGGAYVHNFDRAHWMYAHHLVTECGYDVVLPDYPLLPDGRARESFETAFLTYREMLKTYSAKRIVLMGDSAGGGFALGFLQELKQQGWELPARAVLLSPWLDVSMENPDIAEFDQFDPFLSIDKLKEYGEKYVGDLGTHFPWASPLYGNMEGLVPIDLFTGTHDILCADARKLRDICKEKNIPLHYHEAPDMIHVWMLFDFPESKMTRSVIDRILEEEKGDHGNV